MQWSIPVLLKMRILCYDLTNIIKILQIKACHYIIDLTNQLRLYNSLGLVQWGWKMAIFADVQYYI